MRRQARQNKVKRSPRESLSRASNRQREEKAMAQVLTESTRSDSDSTGKMVNVVLWVFQIAAAGMFLNVGFLKLSGNAQLVALFEAIGIGQWLRYLTGALEVAGAFLLLI